MSEILINKTADETRVAIITDKKLSHLFIERNPEEKLVGNIYKGRVASILPGLNSAFVDIGLGKNAYLHRDDVSDTNKKIEELLKKGQEIIVQVEKESIGSKGPKVTVFLSLVGRLLVYLPPNPYSAQKTGGQVGISKNIVSPEERHRLKKILQPLIDKNDSFIIRTEAEEASEKELKREMVYLKKVYEAIKQKAEEISGPALLHRSLGLSFQIVRDYFSDEIKIMLIDSLPEYRDVVNFARVVSPELVERIKMYEGRTPLFTAFDIEEQIRLLRNSRVDLPSGGYLIIQEAESLCAIDVNTGKFVGTKSAEETITQTNLEAAREIGRQLRLRNIGGIIVIDFIDMEKARNKQKVLEALKEATRPDKAKIKIYPITRLGLIEMTRQRQTESVNALLTDTCPECQGSGRILSAESLFIEVKREIMRLKLTYYSGRLILRLHPGPVLDYFRQNVKKLGLSSEISLDIQPSSDISRSQYQLIVK